MSHKSNSNEYHNICFYRKIRTLSTGFLLLSGAMIKHTHNKPCKMKNSQSCGIKYWDGFKVARLEIFYFQGELCKNLRQLCQFCLNLSKSSSIIVIRLKFKLSNLEPLKCAYTKVNKQKFPKFPSSFLRFKRLTNTISKINVTFIQNWDKSPISPL